MTKSYTFLQAFKIVVLPTDTKKEKKNVFGKQTDEALGGKTVSHCRRNRGGRNRRPLSPSRNCKNLFFFLFQLSNHEHTLQNVNSKACIVETIELVFTSLRPFWGVISSENFPQGNVHSYSQSVGRHIANRPTGLLWYIGIGWESSSSLWRWNVTPK